MAVTITESVTAEPGLSVLPGLDASQPALAAAMSTPPGDHTVVLDGTGCSETACGIRFRATLNVRVAALAASTPAQDELPTPSPDRAAHAEMLGVEANVQALPDELLLVVGTNDAPGTLAAAQQVADAAEVQVTGALQELGIYQVRWSDGRSTNNVRAALLEQPSVAGVDRSLFSEATTESEPSDWQSSDAGGAAKNWPFKAIRAPRAWDLGTGGSGGPTVGVLDPAPAHEHSDLRLTYAFPEERERGNAWFGVDSDEASNINHATHVSGTACATQNGTGVVGVAWGCNVVSAATTKTWDGMGLQWYTTVLTASNTLMGRGARIINMSFGWAADQPDNACASTETYEKVRNWPQDASIKHAALRLVSSPTGRNTVFTIAAGNECLPFAFQMLGEVAPRSNVIIVAASNEDGTLASFSNFGTNVEVAAPGGVNSDGVGVWSTGRYGYVALKGTSMAAPMVAGLANLVWSKHPELSAADVGNCIVATAGSGPSGSVTSRSNQPATFSGKIVEPAFELTDPIPIIDAYNAVRCDAAGPKPEGKPVLIPGASSAASAEVSGDGETVAYSSQGAVNLWDQETGVRTLSGTGYNPYIAANGDVVAYTSYVPGAPGQDREATTEAVVWERATGESRTLTNDSVRSIVGGISGDGSTVFVETIEKRIINNYWTDVWQVRAYDLVTGDSQPLIDFPFYGEVQSISDSGRYAVLEGPYYPSYTCGSCLEGFQTRIYDLQTGSSERVPSGLWKPRAIYGTDAAPRVLFDAGYQNGGYRLAEWDPATGAIRDIASTGDYPEDVTRAGNAYVWAESSRLKYAIRDGQVGDFTAEMDIPELPLLANAQAVSITDDARGVLFRTSTSLVSGDGNGVDDLYFYSGW